MERILKSKLVTCILILILTTSIVVLATDVTVKQGDLILEGTIKGPGGGANHPDGYFNYLYASYHFHVDGTAEISAGLYVGNYLVSYGKIWSYGGFDPPYVLYDRQTGQQIVDLVKREVPPEKQTGAVLFFNKDTKRLETYIPSEGKFYDLSGNVVYTLPAIDVGTEYETEYYFDSLTGEVKTRQELIVDRYVIKKGFRFDRKTGHFINIASGEIVPKETAFKLQEGS